MDEPYPVFVILPLKDAEHLSRTYEGAIAPELRLMRFAPIRVDAEAMPYGIMDRIHAHLRDAYFVVADLSMERPNCYYEVGFADALGRRVLLLKDRRSAHHFNVAHRMVHEFDSPRHLRGVLRDAVPQLLETVKRAPKDTQNGKFGRRCIRDGYRLEAHFEEYTKNSAYLAFTVRSLMEARPLTGRVIFHAHDTYPKSRYHIEARDGIARFEGVESSDGPWTLGAELVDAGTSLELDLATIPGGPDWWYREAYEVE